MLNRNHSAKILYFGEGHGAGGIYLQDVLPCLSPISSEHQQCLLEKSRVIRIRPQAKWVRETHILACRLVLWAGTAQEKEKKPWHLFSSIPSHITADPWKYCCKRSLTVQGSWLTLEAQPNRSSETQCGLPREGVFHRREVPGSTSTSAAPPA